MKSPKDYSKYLPWQLLSVTVATYIICELKCFLFVYLSENTSGVNITEFNRTETFVVSFVTTAVIVLIYEGIYNYNRWKDSLLEAERLKKENLKSELDRLKEQVNPHFLFNSLNTLVSLIPEAPIKATAFVQQLSHVFRYILEMQNRETVSLRDEMDCVNAYLFILQMRFENNFETKIELSESDIDLHLLPLSVQMLIDNAVKHNVISRKQPLQIEIFTENNLLVVRNNLQPKNSEYSIGQGLRNLSRRYALINAGDVIVQNENGFFTVKIPLIGIYENSSSNN